MSHSVIEELREWGCDIEGTMRRLLDDESLYLELLAELVTTPEFEQLGEAIHAGNIGVAFENAHALKGVVGNLGITPLYTQICNIVEPLRGKKLEGVAEMYDTMMQSYQKLCDIVGQG